MKKGLKILGLAAGFVLIVLVVAPFLVPVRAIGEVSDPRQLAYPDSQWIDVDGLDVHVQSAGDGDQAILLLHGFASNTTTWRKALPDLAQPGYQVVAFDRPAFGLTERPESWQSENPYSSEQASELTIGLMDQLKIEQAILIGNSAGGTVAVDAALKYPERIKALVLASPAIYSGAPTSAALRFLFQLPQIDRLGPLVARQFLTSSAELIELAWHDPAKIQPQDLEGYRKPLKILNWDRSLWEFTKASQDLQLPGKLAQLDMPVLVITGDDDRVVPTTDSIRLAGEIPNARLVVIPNCGHVPQEECPEEFIQAVQDFLNSLP